MKKSLLAACLLLTGASFSFSAHAIVDPTTQPPACSCSKSDNAQKPSCNKNETCDCKSGKPKCVKK